MRYNQITQKVEKHIFDLNQRLENNTQTYKQVKNLKEEYGIIKSFLENNSHRIAFIGAIGVGKTHALCTLLDLFHKKKPALKVSSGRTTLCEVEIGTAEETHIIVEPHSYTEVKCLVEEFATSIYDTEENKDDPPISKEIARVLRRMSGLSRTTRIEGSKKVSVDPIKDYVDKFNTKEDMIEDLINRIKYEKRTKTEYHKDKNQDQYEFIKKTFDVINFGKEENTPLAKKINIYITEPILGLPHLNISILDTKGIDSTADRTDLDACINDPKTLKVFCSKFNDAPDKAVRDTIKLAVDAGISDRVIEESLILILDRAQEAENVLLDDEEVEDAEEGREVRKGDVIMDLKPLLGGREAHVTFLNALTDDPSYLSNLLSDKIKDLRNKKRKRLEEILEAILELDKEHNSLTVEKAKKQVLSTLQPWIEKAENFEPKFQAYYEDLLKALKSKKVYASSIRASVNRLGHWKSMDYYYHLGAAARRQVVKNIEGLKDELLYLLNNMLEQENLKPVHALLKQLKNTTERQINKIFTDVFSTGQDVYKDKLEADMELWAHMAKHWGKGPGYKDRIKNDTSEWFQSNEYAKLEKTVLNEFIKQWNSYVNEIKGLVGAVK